MSDKDLIDQVDGWNEEQLRNERHATDLRHKRWMGFGGFIKSGVILALVGAALWFGGGWVIEWKKESNAEQAERYRIADEQQAEHDAKLGQLREEEEARTLAEKKAAAAQVKAARKVALAEADARTAALVECIEKLGMQQCRLIQQNGLEQCWKRGGAENSLACINDYMNVQWGTLSKAEAEKQQAQTLDAQVVEPKPEPPAEPKAKKSKAKK